MNMNLQRITSGEDLINTFTDNHNQQRTRKHSVKGYYVSSKVRKEVLCSWGQGDIVLNGEHWTIEFVNQGDGVWLARIPQAYIFTEDCTQ